MMRAYKCAPAAAGGKRPFRAEAADGGLRGRDERRVRELMDMPMGGLHAAALLIRGAEEPLAFSRLITDPCPRIAARSAWSLGYAAAKGCDISAAEVMLVSGLARPEAGVRTACAYALRHQRRMKGDAAGLAVLDAHADEDVRSGAHLAALDS